MNDSNDRLTKVVNAELTKRGADLRGVVRTSDKPKDAKPKTLLPTEWDDGLAEHVKGMTEGEAVQVEVAIRLDTGKRTARLAGVAPLAKVGHDAERANRITQTDGGFVNPYTFVPTLSRTDVGGESRLAGTGLDDVLPPSHAYHVEGQFSGVLALTLTTVTPLLLPVLAATQPTDGVRTFDVRVGPDNRPLIHGASFKGALRSAYETVTASRYGVFFEHDERLAYRVPANAAPSLTPARVYRDGDRAYFRLCRGDADWRSHSLRGNAVQDAAWVPAYQPQKAHRLGDLAKRPLTEHHGTEVYARVVPYVFANRFPVWRATHLARTEAEIRAARQPDPAPSKGLSPAPGVSPRIVRGWLCATGYSIKTKHDERLFVETPNLDVPLTEEHVDFWRSVLRAYDHAQGYNDPNATYSRTTSDAEGRKVVRSRHVPSTKELRELPDGTLVYVKYDAAKQEITQVHPVMIGRLPFDVSPGHLLHESLRPAQRREQLSPADRLFGWVPPGRGEDGAETNDGASGYRGRLRVRSITCTTDDWKPPAFPPEGVTLAPLSSPKPTQFRFYAAADQQGRPVRRQAPKSDGYTDGGGLRGRKMYRWREEKGGHWEPPVDREDDQRGYLALRQHRQHATQLVRHRGWVRPGVEFRVELHLDGVPAAELAALLWLLSQSETTQAGTPQAPLRLGAGKPYGFGVVTARLDPEQTRLWDHAGIRAGWLRLARPDPVGPETLAELASRFGATSRDNEVLREATESYLAAAKPVTEPVHYPRESAEPQAENYKWFVANDQVSDHTIKEGWSLPHVRDKEQRLPYLDGKSGNRNGSDRTGNPRRPAGPAPGPSRRKRR